MLNVNIQREYFAHQRSPLGTLFYSRDVAMTQKYFLKVPPKPEAHSCKYN